MAISTEKVFDMLPTVVDIYEKIGIEEYRKSVAKENKGKTDVDSMGLGINLFMFVLKNSKNIKEEIFELVAAFEELTIEEAKAQAPGKTIATAKAIFTNKEAVELFKSAVQ